MLIKNLSEKQIIEKKETNSKFFSITNKKFNQHCKILKDDFFIDSFNYFPITLGGHTFKNVFKWGDISKYEIFYTKKFLENFENNKDKFKHYSDAIIIGSSANDNYFTNMVTFLPRIFFLKQKEVTIVINRNSSNKFRNFIGHILKKLNIKLKKFIYLDDNFYKFTNSEIPQFLNKKASFEILNKRFSNLKKGTKKIKIFVSRQNSNYRNLINEDDIVKALKLNGFKIIDTNNMSIFEQIQYFKRAEVVIGPTGSALTNIIFCQKGTKVLEITPKYKYNYEKNFKIRYSNICNILNLKYSSISADSVDINKIDNKVKKYINKNVLNNSNYYKDLLIEKNKIESKINKY